MAVINRPGGVSGSERSRRDRRQVMDLQRSRMIGTVIGAVETQGYAGLTVGEVIARSRISRRTFYEAFADLEDCFLAAFEQTVARGREAAVTAYADQRGWRSGMRAGLLSVLTLMDEERGLARMCAVDALIAGPRVLEARAEMLGEVARAIDAGRAVATGGHDPQPLTAQATAGGIATLLHTRLLRNDPAPLTDLLGALMSMIVMPYLGRAAARRELKARRPRAPRGETSKPSQLGVDPLAQLDMRITYRTVRVLTAIDATPEASNRWIAREAGIIDQGQVSKLLARLARLGLIENTRVGRPGRGANAWRLTAFGAQVQRATRGNL
jgi:AcrR family transcriptional regulator